MDEEQFLRIAKTVADPARFSALQKIAGAGEVSCSNLSEHLGLTAATISHHVKELIASGIVTQRREGKFVILSLNAPVWRTYLRELERRIPKD